MMRWSGAAARWIGWAALGGLWLAGHLAAQENALSVLVVVNAANETTALERTRVSKMFLKQIRTWPGSDLSVVPVDRSEKSPVREAFTLEVHGKKISAIKSYWFRRIFSGRDVPPAEAGSDQEVLDFVRRDPGAIGYVVEGTDLGEGVKLLMVTEKTDA